MEAQVSNIDSYFYHVLNTEGKNMLVPWWFIACYAYEVLNEPLLTDDCFDWLAEQLKIHWNEIEHVHKYKIMKDIAKSSIAIINDKVNGRWPLLAVGAANSLSKNRKKYMNYTDARPILNSAQTMADLF